MREPRSVYNSGAYDGLVMGLLLSVMFLLQSLGMHSFPLLIMGNLLMFAIPVIAFIMLRKGYRLSEYNWTFSAIWLHGIVTFLCGSLILALVVFVFLRFVEPSFIVEQINQVIEAYKSIKSPEANEMARILQQVIDRHMLPTPISVAFSLIWLVSFLGAMLSMVIAFILKFLMNKKYTLK